MAQMIQSLRFDSSREGDVVVVRLSGQLDLANRDHVTMAILDCLHDAEAVVADLSGLTFMDSSGLSSLIRCRKVAAASGREFSVRGAAGQVAQVLTITGLLGLLQTPT
jgi:anti-sigma B factor antagonist